METIGTSTQAISGINGEKKKFDEVWKNIQGKMGKRPDKPREIKKTLDKDDFLKIMLTQMKHQDPTKPFDADKMAQELAQITSVEQLKNINTGIDRMSTQNRPLEKLAMTNLIGKLVTVDKSRFPHTKGQNSTITFGLNDVSRNVELTVLDGRGEKIFETDLGELQAGENSYVWDGNKSNSLPSDSGEYLVKIKAEDSQGKSVVTDTISKSQVIGVSFEGSDPVLLVGDSKNQSKVKMENIQRIDSIDTEIRAKVPDKSNIDKEKKEIDLAVPQKEKNLNKGFPNGLFSTDGMVKAGKEGMGK